MRTQPTESVNLPQVMPRIAPRDLLSIHDLASQEMRALFESGDLTACPVYDIADITKDPHVVARGILIDVPDPSLGTVRMTAPTPRLAATPAAVRWAGPALGAHNRDVYAALGLSDAELESLKRDGIV